MNLWEKLEKTDHLMLFFTLIKMRCGYGNDNDITTMGGPKNMVMGF